ncbi:MAG: hypothetical protein R2734_01220 [Nocardioides sp.]
MPPRYLRYERYLWRRQGGRPQPPKSCTQYFTPSASLARPSPIRLKRFLKMLQGFMVRRAHPGGHDGLRGRLTRRSDVLADVMWKPEHWVKIFEVSLVAEGAGVGYAGA